MSPSSRPLGALAELAGRLGVATGVEEIVDITLAGIDELLGLAPSLLLIHEPERERLVTLASRGYDAGGIGSEVRLGEGVIGMAGERRRTMRIGNLQRMLAYARSVQRSAEGPAEINLPGLPAARSQLAAPMLARDVLVGVLAIESEVALAFDEEDEHAVAIVAHLVGAALEREHLSAAALEPTVPTAVPAAVAGRADAERTGEPPLPTVRLRHYGLDGSTFIDDAYVIKGVAGRLLWKVASEHVATGRTSFTNREARLDPTLELPVFRDNFESRLILLKRRLEERGVPLRLVNAGRGRFELQAAARLELERIDA